ncbi:hypothetical protein VTN96DRAFT_8028 [Rasamsonia emersonii]
MASPNVLKEFSERSLFRRCVSCPDSPPQCNCSPGETCAVISRSCDQCATVTCLPAQTTPTPAASSSSGSNAGAIAGGVIGGLAFVAIFIFLIWWFVIRKKRQEVEQEKNDLRQARQSTRSMASIASTVLTRASNVIQIAYIPGVTNRSAPDTPGTLVPPVPPLPGASQDQHFFMPGDLRDSRFTESTVDRHSIATSLARSSVATTIYRNNAVVSPVPAQQALRTKAAMVSVRPSTSASDTTTTTQSDAPAVPAITQAQLNKAQASSSIVARSVVAKPVDVKRPKAKVPTVSEEEEASDSSSSGSSSRSVSPASHSRARRLDNNNSGFDSSSDEESDDDAASGHHRRSRVSNPSTRRLTPTSPVVNAPAVGEGPFADQSSTANTAVSSARVSHHSKSNSIHRHRASAGSSRLLDGGVSNTAGGASAIERSQSPFSDAHEVK